MADTGTEAMTGTIAPACAATVVEAWIAALPPEATSEGVRPGFWYVRIPGTKRRWIPVEIEVRERTVKVTSHVIIEPEENRSDVYHFLLRRNHEARGVAFSIDGREGVICLVGRLRLDGLSDERLDEVVGAIVDVTETTFRSILTLGFATRLGRGGG